MGRRWWCGGYIIRKISHLLKAILSWTFSKFDILRTWCIKTLHKIVNLCLYVQVERMGSLEYVLLRNPAKSSKIIHDGVCFERNYRLSLKLSTKYTSSWMIFQAFFYFLKKNILNNLCGGILSAGEENCSFRTLLWH